MTVPWGLAGSKLSSILINIIKISLEKGFPFFEKHFILFSFHLIFFHDARISVLAVGDA